MAPSSPALTSGEPQSPENDLPEAEKRDKNNFEAACQSLQQGALAAARAGFQKIGPESRYYCLALHHQGVLAFQEKAVEAAIDFLQRAVQADPDYAEAYNNLGIVYESLGRPAAAEKCYRRALTICPEYPDAHRNVLFCMEHLVAPPGHLPERGRPGRYDRAELWREYQGWDQRHAQPLCPAASAFPNRPDPDRRLRVGLVANDFCRHPVGYFLLPALEARFKEQWELIAYSSTPSRDDLTARLQACCDVWHEVQALSDAAVADKIRTDRIDVLFELSGHCRGGRLLIFAHRPAPVQIAWGGLYNTTGMTSMDYLLADIREVPSGEEQWYSETVVRLPDGYICYKPPAYAPSVSALPARKNGYMTLGCLNNLSKINDDVIALWSQILAQLPDSRLLMHYTGLEEAAVQADFQQRFAQNGISPERLAFRGGCSHKKFLATYQEVDIALDPFPYSGGLTTCESLWMGVPVVTIPGTTFAGRHSTSHLANVGLADWIVDTPRAYVELVRRWAGDWPALANLRRSLRRQMAASPLCDGPRFARNLEQAVRQMWRNYCQAHPGQYDQHRSEARPGGGQSKDEPDPAGNRQDQLAQGEALFSQGRLDEAARIFRAQVAENANDIEALNNLGVVCAAQNDFSQAEGFLLQALAQSPAYLEALANLAGLYVNHRYWDKALFYLEKYHRLDDGNQRIQEQLAIVRQHLDLI